MPKFTSNALNPAALRRVALILIALLCATCQKQPQPERTSTPTPQPRAASTPIVLPTPLMNHPYAGRGIVRIINRKEGWVEIDHEEIVGLMPAMEMEFWVKNKSLMDRVKVGDRVNFTIVETSKGEFLTDMKKAPD